MGKNGRGRGNSSAPRGRGQNGSLHRIRKSASPDPRRPAILLTPVDETLLHSNYVVKNGSITAGKTAGTSKQQQQLQQQQQPGRGSTTSNAGTSSPAVPTSNEFEMLSDKSDDDDDEDDQNKPSSGNTQTHEKGNTAKKRLKSNPPITIVDVGAATIDKALCAGGSEFVMRILKTSVKVITFGQPMFEKALSSLKNANIPYYSHESSDKSAVKVVLTGYNVPSTSEEVMETLAEHKVNPQAAKVLSHTKTVTGNHFLWLLYFERGSVKLQDLRKVKTIDGFLVNWRFFSKRPSDAAQCHRCQRFGHGSRYCTLAPKCVKCGDAHLTAECTLPRKANLEKDKTAEQQRENVKCANCQGNHTANYRGCTARKTYLEALEKQRTKPASRHQQRPSNSQSSPEKSSTNPPGFGRTFASVVSSGIGPTADDNGDGDLFTLSEFLSLARDMFTRLRSCRNKLEQFLALQELMGKYLGSAQV